MSTPQNITLIDKDIERAARLAEAMTADPDASGPLDHQWTAEDVFFVAIRRGLDALEQHYLTATP